MVEDSNLYQGSVNGPTLDAVISRVLSTPGSGSLATIWVLTVTVTASSAGTSGLSVGWSSSQYYRGGPNLPDSELVQVIPSNPAMFKSITVTQADPMALDISCDVLYAGTSTLTLVFAESVQRRTY